MARFALPLAVLLSCFASPALAQGPIFDEPALPPDVTAPQQLEPQQPQAEELPLPEPDEANADNSWRYRRYNGRWWYWLPSERWVVWIDGQWVDYEPGMFNPGGRYYRAPRSFAPSRTYAVPRYYSSPYSVPGYYDSIYGRGIYPGPYGVGPGYYRGPGWYRPGTQLYYSPGYGGFGYYGSNGLRIRIGPGGWGFGFGF